jgi:small subunit ribosomal protein S16
VAVKIKLKRLGKIREPYYRIVVADARTKRDGRAIEEIGKYHPKAEPSLIEVNSERVQHWLSVGAQPTDPVRVLLKITGDWQKFTGQSGTEGTLKKAEPRADKKERFASAAKESQASKDAKEDKGGGKAATQSRAAKPAKDAPKDTAPRGSAAKDGAPKDSSAKDGAPKGGAAKDAPAKDGAPKDGAARGGRAKAPAATVTPDAEAAADDAITVTSADGAQTAADDAAAVTADATNAQTAADDATTPTPADDAAAVTAADDAAAVTADATNAQDSAAPEQAAAAEADDGEPGSGA